VPRRIAGPLTYHAPSQWADDVQPGMRVVVNLGRQTVTGVIVGLPSDVDFDTKPILELPDPEPVCSEPMLDLTRWMSEYYGTPWGLVLKAALPAATGNASRWVISATDPEPHAVAAKLSGSAPRQADILACLANEGELTIRQLEKRLGGGGFRGPLAQLEASGRLRLHARCRDVGTPVKMESVATLVDTEPCKVYEAIRTCARAPKQALALKRLDAAPENQLSLRDLESRWQIGRGSITALVKKGLVRIEQKEVIRRPFTGPADEAMRHELTSDQQSALAAINTAVATEGSEPVLLAGVTGSGKTLVYLEAIEAVVEKRMGVIMLVPEIALTPQTVRRFKSRFGDDVAVLHSQLGDGERADAWRLLKRGSCRIAVGPRSAVFAPVDNLGLIVVDEEHDSSYKQTDPDPRYSARDVAVARGRIEDAAVVLGSATPSLESAYNVSTGKYVRTSLPNRIGVLPMPTVSIIDMRLERASGNNSGLSKALREGVAARLERNEQIVILQNRRGFSPFVQCQSCGETFECPACQVALTYHRVDARLQCHYCGHSEANPDKCPNCLEDAVRYGGIGTQKVQEMLSAAFKSADVIRMDQDTTRGKGAHHRLLESFRKQEASILLGTQMVAKGLDFPNVTLTGVISADVGLGMPDFRASERTFQLLTQVAGRSGRGETPGEVIIQTHQPSHPSIEFAKTHDVDGFCEWELEQRQALNYPPFGKMVWVLLRSRQRDQVELAADWAARAAIRIAPRSVAVKGPNEAPLAKIKHDWRWQILLMGPNGRHVRQAAQTLSQKFAEVKRWRDVRLIVDVDPVSML